ncbi:MAG TPA: NfeD family protein [Actinomycetota bacterium]|nr:NfeD family protein [Actinomycetota bacterium]
MSRVAALLLLGALFAVSPSAVFAQSEEASVLVAEVDGSIDGVLATYVRDSIEDAEASGSTLVLQLDTAGTLDVDPVALAERIHDARVPVVVWVGPSPAKAAGAGLLFLYAASLGAVAPGAGVGPLEPLDLADDRGPSREAIEDLATGWVVERAERGRPTPSVAFPDEPAPAQAALDSSIAAVAATSITDLLAAVDGRTVETALGEVVLHTEIATDPSDEPVTVRFTELGPVDRTLHAAASPTWIYVLLVLGIAALAFEITQPGFGFAGFAGLGMLALAVYGLTVVPFSVLGLALLLLGLGLMTLDVRLRRLGAFTVAGWVGFVAGSVLVFGAVSDAIDVSPWLIGSFAVGASLFWGFALTVAIQTRERLTPTQKGLVGLVGQARGELNPEGSVHVKGTAWRGRSTDGPIPAGSRVRVRGVDGLVLQVAPEPPEEEPRHDPPGA